MGMGYASQLGIHSADPVTESFEFVSVGLRLLETVSPLHGIRGTRSAPKERSKVTRKDVAGPIVMDPTPIELARLLPRILGAAASGTTFALAETVPEFVVCVDEVTKVLTFAGCKCGRASFDATAGGPLRLTMDVVGKTRTVGNAGTFPSLTLDQTANPFTLPELAVVVGGVTYEVDGFQCVVDNVLEVLFNNSLTATKINASDRIITVSFRVPYVDAAALIGAGKDGLTTTATFTNGGSATSCLFSFVALEFPDEDPVVDARGQLWLPINGVARKSGSTNELVVTLDSTA